MDREVKELRVFISSPSDVVPERRAVSSQIIEFNDLWSEYLSLTFRPVTWERNTFPGTSNYPQAVINNQIRCKYDIFLGIMWKRFGTPTPSAGSGTEEEFNEAIEYLKHQRDKVLFYFSRKPISPDSDAAQLKLISDFKDRISSEYGAYYRTFRNAPEFQSLIRIALAGLAQKELSTVIRPVIKEGTIKAGNTVEERFKGLGSGVKEIATNLLLRGTEHAKTTTQALLYLTKLTRDHAATMNHATELTKQIRGGTPASINKRVKKASRPVVLSSYKFAAKQFIAAKLIRERLANGVQDFIDAYVLLSPFPHLQTVLAESMTSASPDHLVMSLQEALAVGRGFMKVQTSLVKTAQSINQEEIAEAASCVGVALSDFTESIESALPTCQEFASLFDINKRKET